MADLVLTFNTQEIEYKEFLHYISNHKKIQKNDSRLIALTKIFKDKKISTVTINVTRFAGGEMAGARGMLELITKESNWLHSLLKKTGLHFISFT